MRRVAERGIDELHQRQLRNFANEVSKAATSGDIVAYLEADGQFHLGLMALLGNPRLTGLVERLRDQTRLYGLNDLSEQGLETVSR